MKSTHSTCKGSADYSYDWWLGQQGKTVKVTKGAFSGYIGRLSGTRGPTYGTVVFRTGKADRAYVREVQVIWADLEVVGDADDSCCQ